MLLLSAFALSVFITSVTLAQAPDKRPQLCLWNFDHMTAARESLASNQTLYQQSYQGLIREAEKILLEPPTSVMDKPDEKVARSKDKHDFISVGKYCWPNPTTPDGMPWIQRDGYINVENFKKDDAVRLDIMCNRVGKLCIAYFFSGDTRFSQKASELVRVWFVDPATRMNPNFTYAQVIPGNDNDRGHFPGVIFGRALVNVLSGLCLIQHTSAYNKGIDSGVKDWFIQYSGWLTTSEFGIKESKATNNHSIAYDEQLLAIALFVGDSNAQHRLIEEFHPKRIFKQVEPDGKMPRELQRTRALGYSAFNIKNILEICEMAKAENPSLYSLKSPDGRSIGIAVDYLAGFLGKKPADFAPYKQIADWDKCLDEIYWIVRRAAAFAPSENYEELIKKYSSKRTASLNNLLY
ncbi:alginate lyase family protein [Chitinophaga sp. MM2321]|uniref:alginate lyase family protein n=1 Tax=Chitinophaga sp. MM2321 TaxID=3137178 RepID=UPI0032D58C2E